MGGGLSSVATFARRWADCLGVHWGQKTSEVFASLAHVLANVATEGSRGSGMHAGCQQMNRGVQAVDRLLELLGAAQRFEVLIESQLQSGEVLLVTDNADEVFAMLRECGGLRLTRTGEVLEAPLPGFQAAGELVEHIAEVPLLLTGGGSDVLAEHGGPVFQFLLPRRVVGAAVFFDLLNRRRDMLGDKLASSQELVPDRFELLCMRRHRGVRAVNQRLAQQLLMSVDRL